jgi:hypothetical protein
MRSRLVFGGALALLLATSWVWSARAQSPSGTDDSATPGAEVNLSEARPAYAHPVDAGAAEPRAAEADDVDMTGIDLNNLDWSQLNVDASTLMAALGSKPSAARRAITGNQAGNEMTGNEMTWSGSDKPNGASAVSVKQSVSPFWDTRIGADMTVTREPTTMAELVAEKAANGGAPPQSSGTVWAAISAPGAGSIWDKTAVEARVDPTQEQSKLGTSISKSVPLSEQYSLTLQNGYSMVQQGLVPVPGIAAHATRTYETEQSAKLSIDDTGTSLIAGQTLSSSDEKWLHKFGAEQKLSDGVSVSGSIGETAQGTTSKSITAGFKRSW